MMQTAKPAAAVGEVPPFAAPYAPADEAIAARLLADAPREVDVELTIDGLATGLIEAIRAGTGRLGGVEDFIHEYGLSTQEGLALMSLAEALLRVPDADDRGPADRGQAQRRRVVEPRREINRLLVSASAWTLGMTARIIQPGETPEGIVDSSLKRLGQPAVRTATRQAMRLLGSHFVLGQTIKEALVARRARGEGYRYSYDMLGEGARTAADAARYLDPMPTPSRRSAKAPATARCPTGRAFPSSSRRCIRATKRVSARAC